MMTIKELKELIAKLPDNFEVCIESDGPGNCMDLPVESMYISIERRNIVLMAAE
jgi:hypothetical protein